MTFNDFLLRTASLLIIAKGLGEIANRLRMPAVVGELFAGILLGYSFLNWIDPSNETFYILSEMGAILLLFEIGLEMDIDELKKAGLASVWVGTAGVVIPFFLAWLISLVFGYHSLQALFIGGVLTATSVGVTARVLQERGWLRSREANIILGAAVLDDVLALIVLSILTSIELGNISIYPIIRSFFMAILFLGLAIGVGLKVAPALIKLLMTLRTRGALYAGVLAFLLLFSLLSQVVGLAPIVGAFACGLLLSRTEHRLNIEKGFTPLADFLTPFFFVIMGAQVKVGNIELSSLPYALLILLVAFIGKMLPGFFVPGRKINRWIVTVGMVPRGEVGLILASYSLSHKILAEADYSLLVLIIMITTFLAPLILHILLKEKSLQ
ncbi:cation:proton antiporter [bacterium]|nr:cation:proton antiporter [bacterium]